MAGGGLPLGTTGNGAAVDDAVGVDEGEAVVAAGAVFAGDCAGGGAVGVCGDGVAAGAVDAGACDDAGVPGDVWANEAATNTESAIAPVNLDANIKRRCERCQL